ncbi:MAG: helix-turn-helix transcriptional regulator [Anaerolineae bacterium]|nr:helix-turn-helix transcriptional regulator [Anaerolineae bacterium]
MRGERLKAVREARELSQKDLAERIGTTDKQIWRYENGLNVPSSDVLARIAKELEVSADYLIGLVENPTDHLREEDLTPMERLLIQAVRAGRISEAVKTAATLAEESEKPPISPQQ